jgi:transposase InsO family protein
LGRGLHLLQDLGRFVYVAFVVDVFAQRIVGWRAATTKVTDLVLTPLRIALWDRDRQRDPGRAGSAAAPLRCREPVHIHPVHQHLELEGIAPSIGTVGDAYPNALMESIIGLFKTEAIATTVFHDGPYKALATFRPASSTPPPANSWLQNPEMNNTRTCIRRSGCRRFLRHHSCSGDSVLVQDMSNTCL